MTYPAISRPMLRTAAALRSLDPGADESPAPVRVALVLPSLAGAGAERQMLSLATNFDRARIDPTVIALKEAAVEFGVRAAGLRTWSPIFGKGVDLAAARRLAAYLRQSNFDVVMCANQYATLQTLLARRLAGVTVQVWSALHSSPGHIGSDLRSKAQQAAYRRALRSCAGLIYVSDLQRQVWEARGFAPGVPAVVINNGIDAAQFATSDDDGIRHRLGWSSEDYVVGICAHLRPEKRVEDLVRAVRLLLERGLPARLLIVGEGPCRVAIEAACREQLGAGRWALAGMQHRVAPFIQACDVMALVSEVESFSIGILEAMASGKPMVVTDVGGAREQIVAGEHGYIVPPAEPGKIAEKLERLWREGSIPAFGAASRARVREKFSIESMVGLYAELLIGTARSEGRVRR